MRAVGGWSEKAERCALCAQGIRRVVAVTGAEAEAAMSKAEGLTVAVDAALGMSGPQLEATATALRQVGVHRLWA